MDFRRDFVEFAVNAGVLRFGAFKTKAGRMSPYFFNAGLFSDGASLARLCGYYADAVLASSIGFDMLFGPAYKGIPLVAGIAVELARRGRNVPFCFNRKEAKDHGEGGTLIGAQPKGRVLIVDDVISAGTSVRESVGLLRGAGAEPCGVAIALDRMEKGQAELSAVQEVERVYGMPVISVATLDDLVAFLRDNADLAAHLAAVESYRSKYGAHALPN
jgi:orotate phosphoribosyltransferase